MQKDITKINEAKIFGIKYPKLIVEGRANEKDFEFKVLGDGKEIECNKLSLYRAPKFYIEADIPKKVKKVEVYILYNDQEKLICKLSNSFFKRIMNKLDKLFGIKNIKRLCYLFKKGVRLLWREHHFLVPINMWGKYYKALINKLKGADLNFYDPFFVDDYNRWLKENEEEIIYEDLDYNPKFSILIPVYNIESEYLRDCLNSILSQHYENFEICLVDDHSTKENVKEVLEEYKKKDKRIKVKYRKENGHISKATNDALEMATGEFIGLMDDDDLLTVDALYQVAKVLNENKDLDLIYSDEDKLNTHGKYCNPNFKPDFSPDTLLSLNYICHFTVARRSLVNEVGGFTVGLEGAQDHDLLLKLTEKTDKIHHIPRVLYHWRMIEGSTSVTISNKDYATDKGRMAIENALKRRNIKGEVLKDEASTYYRVKYLYDKEPLVSIIIPTRDYLNVLKPCIDSIYEKTTYKNFEVIIANNDSKEQETLDFFEEYKKKYDNFKVVDCIMDFNYSRINNVAIEKAKGDYVLLLNNDTEVITEDWISIMVGYAMQEHIGIVGVKLLYPDYTVQHGGVILGLGGVASHAYIGAERDDLGMYGRLRVPYDYSACTAACIMVDKKIYKQVGGLEEELKVAYNDIDFNIKVLKEGYYNVFLPQVELMHYESKSRGLDTTGEKYKRFLEESQYMYDKWNDIIENDAFYNENFSKNGPFLLDKKGDKRHE